MYSQNGEDKIAIDFFKDFTGSLLDIGSNDGKTLSNSLALIERGWQAVLIEPAQIAFDKCYKLHLNNNKVNAYNIAISNEDGERTFYSSGAHLGNGDTDLVSTLSESETKRWVSTTTYQEDVVYCYTFKGFMKLCPVKKFDFISIDAEGEDFEILSQMNLTELGCKMICVEHNSKDTNKFINYIAQFGFKVKHMNAENLIMIKYE